MMHLAKYVREKRGWTLSRMAREMGMTPTNYKLFELSGKSYSPQRLHKLFELCGEPVEKFWQQLKKDLPVTRKKRSDATT